MLDKDFMVQKLWEDITLDCLPCTTIVLQGWSDRFSHMIWQQLLSPGTLRVVQTFWAEIYWTRCLICCIQLTYIELSIRKQQIIRSGTILISRNSSGEMRENEKKKNLTLWLRRAQQSGPSVFSDCTMKFISSNSNPRRSVLSLNKKSNGIEKWHVRFKQNDFTLRGWGNILNTQEIYLEFVLEISLKLSLTVLQQYKC